MQAIDYVIPPGIVVSLDFAATKARILRSMISLQEKSMRSLGWLTH